MREVSRQTRQSREGRSKCEGGRKQLQTFHSTFLFVFSFLRKRKSGGVLLVSKHSPPERSSLSPEPAEWMRAW